MKILYAIQGTGNGHISRAREIIPHLANYGELDLIVSGTQADVYLPYPVKYKKKGISFIFGKKGGVDYWETFKSLRTKTFVKEVLKFPVHNYDLIINDFEPITAWACYFKDVKCVAMSHQSSFLSDKTPRPEIQEKFGELLLRKYAPANSAIGFHFNTYDDFIHTPIIRSEIRMLEPSNNGHYTVYLPSYSDESIIKHLSEVKKTSWQVFSKHSKKAYSVNNVHIKPINNELFNLSLSSCEGLLTGAGFESPAEALYLGKKLLVIPMQRQYEQQCNAEALKLMGVPVIAQLNSSTIADIKHFTQHAQAIPVNYADNTANIVASLF